MDSPMKQTSNMDSLMNSFGDHAERKTDQVSAKNSLLFYTYASLLILNYDYLSAIRIGCDIIHQIVCNLFL